MCRDAALPYITRVLAGRRVYTCPYTIILAGRRVHTCPYTIIRAGRRVLQQCAAARQPVRQGGLAGLLRRPRPHACYLLFPA